MITFFSIYLVLGLLAIILGGLHDKWFPNEIQFMEEDIVGVVFLLGPISFILAICIILNVLFIDKLPNFQNPLVLLYRYFKK